MGLENIRVVLVSPIYGGNVGSVCRAMKNMGITDLAIVAPRECCEEVEARRLSCHGEDVFNNRREFDTLPAAVADCILVAGTTGRPGLYRAHAKTPRGWAPRLMEASASGKVALVFGTEDNGLSNEDIAACTHIIQIPSSPACPSLNLSHAVMVCCYELFAEAQTFVPPQESSPEAPSDLRERMFAMWRQSLLDIKFMEPDKADHMMLALRRIFARGPLSVKDVQILMGISRQTLWAVQRWRSGQAPTTAPEPGQADVV